MAKLRFNITISLDGYVAGPDQSLEDPLGKGGHGLHDWAFATRTFRAMHRARLIDEMEIHVVPMLLGGGSRLFENLDGGPAGYECVDLSCSPAVAHYTYVQRDRG